MNGWGKVFAVLALGPLTGPLVLAISRYACARQWFMVGVCCLGLVEVWVGLPALLASNLAYLAGR